MPLHTNTLCGLHNMLETGQCSSLEITEHFLHRIEKFNPSLNAYITPTPEIALTQAKAADKTRAQCSVKDRPPLLGLPIAHKDIFCMTGIRTTCGSRMLEDFVAPYESTVTEKLTQAGMISLGKTNMDEFAMGSSNENSYFGPCKNPWNIDHVPGGSSGGSAAAVAAQLAPIATGSDTGGSIRQPAAYCGLSGLKPTYGRISRWGMVAYASSLDQAGLIGRTAEDIALVMQSLSGFDPKDSTSANVPVPQYLNLTRAPLPKKFTVGLPDAYFNEQLDSSNAKLIGAAKQVLSELGAEFVSISLPHLEAAIPTYYLLASAESSSNLARYDGIRFGYRSPQAQSIDSLYAHTRAEGFGEEVKRRILLGTYALCAGYYEAYYHKSQQVRALIQQDFLTALNTVDWILAPTAPGPAFKLGEKTQDPLTMYLSDIYTIAANLAGLPAMSIPMGFQKELPFGLQLIGNLFDEAKILQAAHHFQQATDWHNQWPNNFS